MVWVAGWLLVLVLVLGLVLVCVGRFVRVWWCCLQSIEHSQAISGG
jgi:hypothetical protein